MENRWNWQQANWPNFTYQSKPLQHLLYRFAQEEGRLSGCHHASQQHVHTDLILDMLVQEAFSTSAIEGEFIQASQIRSSIKRELGMKPQTQVTDKRAAGISGLLVAVRKHFADPLSADRLFNWHHTLMQGADPYHVYQVGMWRMGEEPMEIVSYKMGRQHVHFHAPPSSRIPAEMSHFIDWYNQSLGDINLPGPIRAGIAHLYFESIHPFQDGNGRIGRALVDKALSQALGYPTLFSISAIIEKEKRQYYHELSDASKWSLDITQWLIYFLNLLLMAIFEAKTIIDFAISKAKFWEQYELQLNERQKQGLQRMLQEGLNGFEGGMSAKKWMSLLDVSKATATRDLMELQKLGCLEKLVGGGRSTRYKIYFQKERD